MALEDALNLTAEPLVQIVSDLGRIGLWLQTLGIVIIIWLAFQAFLLFINARRLKVIQELQIDVRRLERKIDKMGRK